MKKYFLDGEKLSNLSSALVRFEIDSNGKVVKHNTVHIYRFKEKSWNYSEYEKSGKDKYQILDKLSDEGLSDKITNCTYRYNKDILDVKSKGNLVVSKKGYQTFKTRGKTLKTRTGTTTNKTRKLIKQEN